jgi:hypothetical protein
MADYAMGKIYATYPSLGTVSPPPKIKGVVAFSKMDGCSEQLRQLLATGSFLPL